MNINEIKLATGQTTIAFVRQFAEDGVTPTEWVSHWDNTKRIRVTAHEQVMNTIKENPAILTLGLKTEVVPEHGEVKAYTRHVIITPKNVEFAI